MRHVISRLRVCRRRRLRAAYRERDIRQYAYGHRRGAPVPVALVNVIGHLIVSNTTTVFPFVHEASCGPRLYRGIDIMARSKTARRLGTTLWSENNTYPQMPGVSRHDMPKRHRTWHTMGRMSDNTTQRMASQNRMWHVRPTQVPTTSYVASLDSRLMRHTTAHSLTTCSIRWNSSEKFLWKQKSPWKTKG